MGWGSAIKKTAQPVVRAARAVQYELAQIDWDRLVTIDLETYFDQDYTLKKMSTSEYVRDKRFKAQMVGIKIGRKKTRVFAGGTRIMTALKSINWSTHALLCHNTAFDGLILSHHYGVVPKRYYDTLSMARGLHSNEIGGGLDEVSVFYGGEGKIKDTLELTAGVLNWDRALITKVSPYCERDVDECHRIFTEMAKIYPASEMDLIHITVRMFCDPVLRVDLPRVQREYEREVTKRKEILLSAVPNLGEFDCYDERGRYQGVLDKKSGRDTLTGDDRRMAVAKKVVGSNERYVQLLMDAGVPEDAIPRKISPAWMKLDKEERLAQADKKWGYAFAKDDLEFVDLPERVWEIRPTLNPNKEGDVIRAVAISEALRALVAVRLAVKSTTNITRAERFLEAGRNGCKLPVGYSYFRAHTGRWGGNNKMNMQNLTRGGELRLSILADKGHAMAVCDSGQIEARVNGWLWDQDDLLEAFRTNDAYNARVAHMPKKDRPLPEPHELDAYCRFATSVYGRPVNVNDKDERFLGKVCVLGLGYQMGVDKFQMTLARGAMGGPRINFTRDHCGFIVNTYRSANYKIVQGWKKCASIIEDMAVGVSGEHKCISWGGDGEGNGWVLLPNGMSLKYPQLRKARNEEKGFEEWTYQSGDARKKIYGGLLCLAGDTEVLTDSGWKALAGVGRTDRVWDGVQWVSHDGVAYQGTKNVIDFGGVWMTPDHQVFSGGGWHEAQYTTYTQATSSFTRHFRAPPWFTDGGGSTWQRRTPDAMESSVRLRSDSDHLGDGVHEGQDKVVRVSHEADAQRADEDARHVQASSLCRLAQHVPTLPQPHPCGVPALRGARDQHLQPMVDVCAVLGGHGGDVPAWPDSGAQGQQQELLARKLCVGDLQGAVQQQAHLYTVPDASRGADDLGSDGRQWAQPQHSVLPAEEQMAHGETAIPVYDIVNAGPNRRFTVRGADGRPFVVHNCENLVQALARIIVAEQMLMIDKKYRCVMTTHDEVVAHPKLREAEKCYQFMYQCMTTPLWWCPDIPLAAEGGWAENYSK